MRIYEYTYESTTTFESPVTQHSFLLRAEPVNDEAQQVMDPVLEIEPECRIVSKGKSSLSGVHQYGYISEPHDRFRYRSTGKVRVTGRLRYDPHPSPAFRQHSLLADFSREMTSWCIFGEPLEAALAMAEHIKMDISYSPGTTTVLTKASSAFGQRCGVCQDFAHILISLCRQTGIAARYVCGLVLGEGQTHAWTEIWTGGRWYGIDPTSGKMCDDRYIALGFGRDASDCPVNRGVFTGVCAQSTDTHVIVKELEL